MSAINCDANNGKNAKKRKIQEILTVSAKLRLRTKKLCMYKRGEHYCQQTAFENHAFCKYHKQGNAQLDPDIYLSVRTGLYHSANAVAPEEGDLKCHNGSDIYKFDAKKWRKCCQVCFNQAKPDYCKKHDPAHISTGSGGFSKMGCEFLDELSIELGKPIIHRHVTETGEMENDEFRIPGTLFRVDGYDPETKSVYEYLGDYWHGSLTKYKSDDVNQMNKQTFGELHQKTFTRLNEIAQKGFNVYYIWEGDFKNRGTQSIRTLLQKI